MGGTWKGLGLLVAALIGLAGCASTDDNARPPRRPEEYTLPPDDPRYAQPPNFPKGTLNNDVIHKNKDVGDPKDDGPTSGRNGRVGPTRY
jgi:hypothetical protein